MKKFLLPTIVVCSLLFASVAMGAYKYSGMTQEEKKALYTKLSIDTEKKLQEFEAIDKKGVETQDKDIQLKAQKAGEDFKKRSIEQADIHNEIDAVDYDQRINEIIDAATLEIPNVNENFSESYKPIYNEHMEKVKSTCDKYSKMHKEKKLSSKDICKNLEAELDKLMEELSTKQKNIKIKK